MALRRRNPSSFACISPLLSHQQSPGLCLSQPWGQAAASAGAWSSAASRAPPSLVDAAPALFSAGLFCPWGSFLSSPGPRSPGSTASSTQIVSVVKLVTSPCPSSIQFPEGRGCPALTLAPTLGPGSLSCLVIKIITSQPIAFFFFQEHLHWLRSFWILPQASFYHQSFFIQTIFHMVSIVLKCKKFSMMKTAVPWHSRGWLAAWHLPSSMCLCNVCCHSSQHSHLNFSPSPHFGLQSSSPPGLCHESAKSETPSRCPQYPTDFQGTPNLHLGKISLLPEGKTFPLSVLYLQPWMTGAQGEDTQGKLLVNCSKLTKDLYGQDWLLPLKQNRKLLHYPLTVSWSLASLCDISGSGTTSTEMSQNLASWQSWKGSSPPGFRVTHKKCTLY